MKKVCIFTIVCIVLVSGFYNMAGALSILFWDDFEDGKWDDKWIEAAQGSYQVINAAEYQKIYGAFPLGDANNKGVLVFGGDQGLANTKDHSLVAKAGPFTFATTEGITFESMAQWVAGGQHFVLSASETDTTGLERNLAYFEPHIRAVLDPLGVIWTQTHWPLGNHITHEDKLPDLPPEGSLSKVSFYLNDKIYKLYIDGKMIDSKAHQSGLKKGYMSWSTTGGWGLLDNVVIYTGDYNSEAFKLALYVNPSRNLVSTWGVIKR